MTKKAADEVFGKSGLLFLYLISNHNSTVIEVYFRERKE